MKYETKVFGSNKEMDEYLNSLEGEFEIVNISYSSKFEIVVTIKK